MAAFCRQAALQKKHARRHSFNRYKRLAPGGRSAFGKCAAVQEENAAYRLKPAPCNGF
jgi:hypothetical protein